MTLVLAEASRVDLPPAQSDGMSLSDLDRLRRAVPGCEVAMLADLSTHTVLGTSAALALPQEMNDLLCHEATSALTADGQFAGSAVLVRPLGTRAFLRAPGHPDEVLCIVAAPGIDVSALLRSAGAALSGLDPSQEAEHEN